ncbi:MAG: hypothetical protein ACOYL6_09435 [Bacteriovoracaceae bacterium]
MAKVSQIKDFKLLKENKAGNVETIFVADLVLGSHPIALKLLKELSQDNKEEVLLIHEFDFKDALNFHSPRLFRGEKAFSWISSKHSELKVEDHQWGVKFYKDGEKRDFGSRVKSHEIRDEEKFFTEKPYFFNETEFYGELADYAHLEKKHIKAFIKKISSVETNELASRIHFEVELSDGTRYQCENLYCTFSPSKFVSYLDKDKLSLFPMPLFTYARNLKPLPSLYIQMNLKGEWEKDLSTLFIPQSQTHEWGSFIVEFEAFNEHQKTQKMGVFCYISELEMADNEEVAKKIRLMKRVIERVYVGLEKQIINENITLSADFIHANCEDSPFQTEKNTGSMEHLKLVHIAGPSRLDADLGTFSSLSRMFINYFN